MNTAFIGSMLHGVRFENSNLSHATFQNINLDSARFDDVNLQNACITNANIRGLTICGYRIDLLIAAEHERQDPERAALRIHDPSDPSAVRDVFTRLGDLRANFKAALQAAPWLLLQQKAEPEQWSIIEELRHLIFADDLYLNLWIAGEERAPSAQGLLPTHFAGHPGFSEVGSAPPADLASALHAWNQSNARLPTILDNLTPSELQRQGGNGENISTILQELVFHNLQHIRRANEIMHRVSKTVEPSQR